MRNKTIDQSRLVAALLVVIIHAPLPGVFGTVLESIARFAVPFFFMVSGYFAFGKDKAGLKRQTIKTLKLFLFALAVNLLWDILASLYRGNTLEMLSQRFSVASILEAIVLNTGALLGHIWFLLALVYVYGIYSLLFGNSRASVRMSTSATLLLGFFVLREVLRAFGISDVVYYIRNFLFVGIPFFLLGTLCAEYKDKIGRIKPAVLVLVGAVGVGLSVADRFLIGGCDMYFGTPLLAASFFMLSVMDILPCSTLLTMIGRKYSRDIYVFHNIVLAVINIFASLLGILQNKIFLFVRPLVIITVCIIGLWVLYKLFPLKNKAVKD